MVKIKKNAVIEQADDSNEPASVEDLVIQFNKNRSYRGTQQNLYSYARLGWRNYFDKLANFTNFSGMYTQALGDDAMDFIASTEALPSYEALVAAHVEARNELIEALVVLLGLWQDMKVLATKAFSPAILPSKLRAAGSEQYGPAAGYSWDDAAELIRMGTTFLSENSAALLANNNMPSTFPATYAAAGEAFSAKRTAFLSKEKLARNGIVLKSQANEQVYASLIEMTTAGKAIYRRNENERRNFTVSLLLKEVRGNSPGGIHGQVTTGMNPAVPLSGVRLVDQNNPERFAITADDGSYELHMPSGKQTVVLTMEGYVTQVLTRKMEVGTMHRQSFSMEPAPVAPAPLEPAPVEPAPADLSAPPAIQPQATAEELLKAAVSGIENGKKVESTGGQ